MRIWVEKSSIKGCSAATKVEREITFEGDWRVYGFWVSLSALVLLTYVEQAWKTHWYVDDYYFFPFLEKSLLASLKMWYEIWGFERLQYIFLARIFYPLGEGYAQVALLGLHLLCAVALYLLMTRMQWPSQVALGAALLFCILPFQYESVLWVAIFCHVSHLAVTMAALFYIEGAYRKGRNRWLYWFTAGVLGVVSCTGYGTYTFAPLIILLIPVGLRTLPRNDRSKCWVGTLLVSLLPVLIYIGFLLVKRYELRGDPTFENIPRVLLSTQWHALRDILSGYRSLLMGYPGLYLSKYFLYGGIVCSCVLAYVITTGIKRANYFSVIRYYVWAYGLILVGYSIWWFRGASPGVPRMHYFASMGIAAAAAGIIYGLRARSWYMLAGTRIMLAGIIFATAAISHERAWTFVSNTEQVALRVRNFKPVPTQVFAEIYAECGRIYWVKNIANKSVRPIYDKYYIMQWVKTGYWAFWPSNPEEDEMKMCDALKMTYGQLWPLLDDEERISLARKAAEIIGEVAVREDLPSVRNLGVEVRNSYPADLGSLDVLVEALFKGLFLKRKRLDGLISEYKWETCNG
jgi:hypothetical protein